jgi:acyl-CoA dehydrogenase
VDRHVTRTIFEDEHRSFRETAARFMAEHVAPYYAEWDAVPAAVYQAAASHGLLGMGVAEEHGGLGIDDPRFRAVVIEEAMAAGAAAFALGMSVHNDVCVPVLNGSPQLASGTLLAAFADRGLSCTDGRLWGTASFTVNGLASDMIIAVAGDALYAVDATSVSRTPSPPLIGLRAADLGDLTFEAVPATRVGDADDLCAARTRHWIALAVASIAAARMALDLTLSYIQERRVFGQPIAEFENTQMALGGLAAEIHSVQALVDACLLAQTPDPSHAAAAKLCASELLGRTVDAGVQLHGGYGYMSEYPISTAFVDARYLRVHGSSSEELRRILAHSLGPCRRVGSSTAR